MEYYSAIKKNKIMPFAATCSSMDGLRDYHTKWSKPDRERKTSYDIAYMWNLQKNDTNELIYKTEIDPQTQKTNLELAKGKWGGGDKLGLTYTHYYT